MKWVMALYVFYRRISCYSHQTDDSWNITANRFLFLLNQENIHLLRRHLRSINLFLTSRTHSPILFNSEESTRWYCRAAAFTNGSHIFARDDIVVYYRLMITFQGSLFSVIVNRSPLLVFDWCLYAVLKGSWSPWNDGICSVLFSSCSSRSQEYSITSTLEESFRLSMPTLSTLLHFSEFLNNEVTFSIFSFHNFYGFMNLFNNVSTKTSPSTTQWASAIISIGSFSDRKPWFTCSGNSSSRSCAEFVSR